MASWAGNNGCLLGDVGAWWQVLAGVVLIWVAPDMLGVRACSMSGSPLSRLNLKGIHGAQIDRKQRLAGNRGVVQAQCRGGYRCAGHLSYRRSV